MSILEITGFDCGGEQVLKAIKFIMGLLDAIFILLPIILTLLLVIDFIKNIMALSEDTMKKQTSLMIKRVIICIAVFLVEPITHLAINAIGNNEDNYVTCIKIAKETKDLSIYEIKVPEVKNNKSYSFKDKKSIVVNPKEEETNNDISKGSEVPQEVGALNNATLSKVTVGKSTIKEKYESDNTKMTVTEVIVNNHKMTVFHIKIKSASQLGEIQAKDKYGTGVEKITSMVDRVNKSNKKVILAVTGAFFLTGTGEQNIAAFKNNHGTTDGIVIQNGKLVANNGSKKAWGHEICQDKNGNLFYAPQGTSADDLIKSGVVNTFASHESRGLQNGQLLETGDNSRAYARSYLAMKKPKEYYVVQTEPDATRAETLSYIKNELNCTFAGSLEQGGAVASVTPKGVIKYHTGYAAGIGDAFVITE